MWRKPDLAPKYKIEGKGRLLVFGRSVRDTVNISKLLQEADAGSVVAQSVLGICYLDGINVEVNYKEALRLLTAAARRGAPRAKANLARMYVEGLGVQKDLPEAMRLYEEAANAGEFFAQIELARIFLQGLGVPADPGIALKWYSAAAAAEGKIDDCDELREAKTFLKSTTRSK
jgi:TPR repeat protein